MWITVFESDCKLGEANTGNEINQWIFSTDRNGKDGISMELELFWSLGDSYRRVKGNPDLNLSQK